MPSGSVQASERCKPRQGEEARTWPTHYHVSEVGDGLEYIQKGRNQGHGTIAELYRGYYGQEMIRSTFKLNRTLWDEKIPSDLKLHFRT